MTAAATGVASIRDELRSVPGVWWILVGAAVALLVSVGGIVSLRREEGLSARAARADSVAHEKTLEAAILRRDATADSVLAVAATRRAEASDAETAVARAALRSLSERAAAASAAVDRRTLAPDVAEALATADTFRIAVTPQLVRDSVDVAQWRAAAEMWQTAYDRLADSDASLGAALLARESQARAVQQEHAPRCGAKCGAAIAVVVLEGVRALVQAFAR